MLNLTHCQCVSGIGSSCQSFKDVDNFLFSRFLSITLVFLSKSQRFLRVGLAVPILSTVAALRRMVAEEGGIPVDEVWWNCTRAQSLDDRMLSGPAV